jgi:hypothetical protein
VESLAKIGAPTGAPLTLHSSLDDGWVLLSGGAYRVATCVLARRGAPEPLALAVALREGS